MATKRWFHPHVTGQQAEDMLLKEGQDGSFLVRPSQTNPGDFTLSVRQGNEVTHLKVQNAGDHYDLYGGEKFATLGELVSYYMENPGTLREKSGVVIELKNPLFCEEVTAERWYHSNITGREAETLLLSKGQDGSFLVRASVHNPGYYVLSTRVDERVSHIIIRNKDGAFDVGGGPTFGGLTPLIEHYKKNPMVVTSGSVIHLKYPFNATSFLPANIFQRVSELRKQNPDVYGKTGFWEEFEQLQQQDCKYLYSRKEAARPENKSKNRYKHILPFDHTRVILKESDPSVIGSDYINANYISGEVPGSERRYIATQGCLPATVLDFWKMIWQENTRVIVMTTNEMERGRNMCTRYWPDPEDNKTYGSVHVINLKETPNPHYILREFLVHHEEDEDIARRSIFQYHSKAWPHHGVPHDPGAVLGFLQDVTLRQSTLATEGVEPGPLVVHSSEGVGRTGTFIVIEILLNLIAFQGWDNEIDIQKTIQLVRAQRHSMVQTELQYKFVYMAIKHYVESQQALMNVLPGTHESEEETFEPDLEEADSHLENLLERYCNQRTIKLKSLKCLFTGPPQVGKTTLKKRLLRVIKNLISSGEVSPSGGLEKPISVIIGETRECVTVVIESDIDWQLQRDLLDEAQLVLEFIDQHPTTPHLASPALVPPIPVHTQVSPEPVLPTPVLPTPVPPTPVPPTPVLPTPVPPKPVPSIPAPPKPDSPTPGVAEVDEVKQLMQAVLSSRKLRSIKDIEKTTTIYLMDTGGQPEFHEIMPVILNGPALHMVFFNLAINLDDSVSVRFYHQDGTDSMITYNSSYTGKQMIFQLLSSLYCLSMGISPDCEPAAVLIATHLDQLKNQEGHGENKIEEINDSLKELLSNAEFHDQAFLTYPKEDEKSTIFIPVNNYSGDEEEIKQLQAFLRLIIHKRFGSVELPSSWLFFHLILRHRYENSPGVCTLAECRAIAKGCDLDENDVPQVLRYIHRHLGTILFYEEVQGLNELVICDPNLLFKGIYQLVAVSFGGDEAQHTITTEIRKTGEIPVRVLERIGTQPSHSLLTNEHIINLLKHFKILTELHSDEKIVYFMPCLLKPDNSLQLSCEALQTLCPPPLLVRFDGNYIPIGVFSALVVKLSESSWEPDRDTRYRNHILFHTDGVFPVELIVQPAYLEFRIRIASYKEELEEIHRFCIQVRARVVRTLKSALGLHEHTKKTKFQLGFYCSGRLQADVQPHFCGCLPRQNHINPKSYVCSKSPRCQDQCRLPHECTIWFEYWKDKEITRDKSHAPKVFNSVGNTSRSYDAVDSTLLDKYAGLRYEPKMANLMNEIAVKLPDKWQDIGRGLGLEEYELKRIQIQHGWQQSTNVFFSCVFDKWYSGKKSPYTWEQVLKVLYQPAVGGNRIADELKKKYRVT